MSNDNENRPLTKEQQREAIKEAFRTRDTEIEIIPAHINEKQLLNQNETILRVGLYSRVSTDNLEQASSIALQETSFDEIKKFHPNWDLVETYTDEGISGTSTKRRLGFQRMISDAEAGKLDLIVTRSVSRFARNLLDCVQTYRHLASLPHPVYVYFVSNNIITNGQGEQSEMILNFMAMIAQEESHIKSDVMNSSIEHRFGIGKFLVTESLGFDRHKDYNTRQSYLTINKEEAETVREMYGLLLTGHTCSTIAKILMEEGRLTKKKRTKWSAGTVESVLRNEKNKGAIYARKTYTPNYLDHKSKKNRGERTRYKKENHHEGIISSEVYAFAIKILNSRKHRRNSRIVDVLSVIKTGILRGFVLVQRGWLGTDIDDYIEAYRFAYPTTTQARTKQVQFGNVSNFNLSGYESVSPMLLDIHDRPVLTIDYNTMLFNRHAIRKMDEIENVELLFNPNTFEIAVRAAEYNNATTIKWYNKSGKGLPTHCKITLRNFTAMLFDYMQWDPASKIKVYGECRTKGAGKVMFFSLRDIEILIPKDSGANGRRKYESYYPQSFINQYGEDAYQSIYSTRAYLLDYFKVWDACVGSVAIKEYEMDAKIKKAAAELLKKTEV